MLDPDGAVFTFDVGIALRRPPAEHAIRRVVVDAVSLAEATLVACQLAMVPKPGAPRPVMAVAARLVNVEV